MIARANTDKRRLLHFALLGDAVFETVCGIVFIIAASALAQWTGWNVPSLFVVAGVLLLGVAVLLYWMVLRPQINRQLARAVALLNVVSGICGVLVLIVFWGSFTDGARWLVALIAFAVGIFGVLEFVGLRRST
jgi:hypothetical protein